jgi:lactate dehydrogenase-like 2-hydroxyacid dehydrogenase
MFDVHLTTIKVIDIENNKVVIDSTFGEKEYVLDKIKNGVRFELPKYKSALQYQEKNDVCYVFTNDITARLQMFPQLVLTSHQAFFTREALQAIAVVTMENARNFNEGNELGNAECKA